MGSGCKGKAVFLDRKDNEGHYEVGNATRVKNLFPFCSCTALAQNAKQPATFTSFDFPGVTETQATAINIGGKIVGRYASKDGIHHGFLRNGTHYKSIDVVGATQTDVTWINRYDQISGSYTTSDGKSHGFWLSSGVFTTINYPGALNTYGYGIGDNGDVVGIEIGSNNVVHGYLLKNRTFSSINFPGATGSFPTMVVGQRIVGGYFIGAASQVSCATAAFTSRSAAAVTVTYFSAAWTRQAIWLATSTVRTESSMVF